MSAFLKAIENVDDIFLTRRMKEVFVISMQKFHDYFEKNNLLEVINLNEFFEKYLYKSTYPQFYKLKIKFKKERKSQKYPYPNFASYDCEINELLVYEMSKDYLEIYKTEERMTEEYIATFVHEFIHFLTLHGRVQYVENGKVMKIKPSTQIKVKRGEISHENIYGKYEIFEPLTEILTNKIMGRDGGMSYKYLMDFFNILNDIFNIKSDKEFLRRNYEPYINAMGLKNFNKFQKIASRLLNASLFDKKTTEYINEAMEILDEMFVEYYTLIKDKITPNQFLTLQAKYYNGLPYSTYKENAQIYNNWIKQGNLTYVKHLLEKYNLKETPYNLNKIQNIFVKAIGLADAQIYAKKHNADFGVRVRIKDRTLVFLVKDDKLSVMSINNIKEMSEANLIDLNKDISFKEAELDFNYQDMDFDRKTGFEFKKEKGKNYLTLTYNKKNDEENNNFEESNNLEENTDKLEVKLSFENGKITIAGPTSKGEYSKENTQKFLQNFDLIILNEIKMLKNQKLIQSKVKERGLIVKPQENTKNQI